MEGSRALLLLTSEEKPGDKPPEATGAGTSQQRPFFFESMLNVGCCAREYFRLFPNHYTINHFCCPVPTGRVQRFVLTGAHQRVGVRATLNAILCIPL